MAQKKVVVKKTREEYFRIYHGDNMLAPDPCFSEPTYQLSPCHRLVWALLGRALRDFYNSGKSKGSQRIRREASKWIFDRRPEEELRGYSFKWVCEILDIPVECARKRIAYYHTKPEEIEGLESEVLSWAKIKWQRLNV